MKNCRSSAVLLSAPATKHGHTSACAPSAAGSRLDTRVRSRATDVTVAWAPATGRDAVCSLVARERYRVDASRNACSVTARARDLSVS